MQISLITGTYNRAEVLRAIALPSILGQSDLSFEWVVINDGQDPATRDLILHIKTVAPPSLKITDLEMLHPPRGFSLCYARNLGLEQASGDLVAYLDDDNSIAPNFIAATKQFFSTNQTVKCSMVQQQRRRDVVQAGQVVSQGKVFVSPTAECTVADLIQQKELIDSNGFAHYRIDAPQWNPDYQVFADYEFFLQCLSRWGQSSFRLNPKRLVDYVQRSDGVIGQSSYSQWVDELRRILTNSSCYPALENEDVVSLEHYLGKWQQQAELSIGLSAFSTSNKKQQ